MTSMKATEPMADVERLVMILGNLKAICIGRLNVNPVGYSPQAMKREALRMAIGEDTEGRSDAYVDARFATVLDSTVMALPDATGTVH